MGVPGFTASVFAAQGRHWPVFWRGEGPGVLVLHEVPGITDAVAAFARRLADDGFCVAMPQLFGSLGGGYGLPRTVAALAGACISREFNLLARGRRSPITDPLRALASALHQRCGGPGVGAVGMCLTGNFALSLVLDAPVIAPVLSQPSLPLGLSAAHRADPHLSPAERQQLAARCGAEGIGVLGLRFTGDLLCPASRFASLREDLGPAFEGIEIDSGRGNPHGLGPTAHSVLTRDLVDVAGHPTREALDRVLAFLHEALDPVG